LDYTESDREKNFSLGYLQSIVPGMEEAATNRKYGDGVA
jgi:hypothetical protein